MGGYQQKRPGRYRSFLVVHIGLYYTAREVVSECFGKPEAPMSTQVGMASSTNAQPPGPHPVLT